MDDFKAEERGSYRRWTREILRYADLDPVGHVNNNAYGLFVENARTMLFTHAERAVRAAGGSVEGFDWVVRRQEFDYLREVRYPGEIEVGVVITRVGNSSMIMRHGIFTADYCAATSIGVSVCFDMAARESMRIPDDIRQVMWDAAGLELLTN